LEERGGGRTPYGKRKGDMRNKDGMSWEVGGIPCPLVKTEEGERGGEGETCGQRKKNQNSILDAKMWGGGEKTKKGLGKRRAR